MTSLGILAGDAVFKTAASREFLSSLFEVHDFSDWRSYDPVTLLEKCRSVDVVVTGRSSPRLPPGLAAHRGRLRYVCHLHGTIKHLVDKSLLEAGLIVTNWGNAVDGVAEGAMALLLCQLKQISTLNAWTKGAADERIHQTFPATLTGRDVGLYGFGPIGRHMARMLEPFEPRIAVYDPFAKYIPAQIRRCVTLRELFASCQIISIHCGLNNQTKMSVTRELLELLPQGGIVINTARGDIVDENALAELVAAKRLLAGCDVVHNEKNWTSSPLAPLPGAILTRHKIGSGKGYPPGQEPEPALPDHAKTNLRAFAEGKPLIHVVTAEEYDLKT
jgi:phosphoglycerate dehydrogenase-like enzyme